MSPNKKRISIFANGPLPSPERIASIVDPADFLIAADGGLRHLSILGLTPQMLVGDLDSADPGLVQTLKNKHITIRQHPADKDQTDLELALTAALELQPESIRIVGALGGRIDQTLGNIFLLTKPELAETDIRLIDSTQEVFLIRESAQLQGQPNQRVSLLPLNGSVKGIRTTGLKYPLNNETLYPDQTRGISNLMVRGTASITINQGLLLCIHEFSTQAP
jgi:thiamine pyrophosphokinase